MTEAERLDRAERKVMSKDEIRDELSNGAQILSLIHAEQETAEQYMARNAHLLEATETILNGRDNMDVEAKYHGWTNYPTWNVNLYLANTEWMYKNLEGMREDLILTGAVLKAYVWEQQSDTHGSFGDLTQEEHPFWMEDVNWDEIAGGWNE